MTILYQHPAAVLDASLHGGQQLVLQPGREADQAAPRPLRPQPLQATSNTPDTEINMYVQLLFKL